MRETYVRPKMEEGSESCALAAPASARHPSTLLKVLMSTWIFAAVVIGTKTEQTFRFPTSNSPGLHIPYASRVNLDPG